MATHSSILVCRNPWTEPGEPGRLQSMGCKESYVLSVTTVRPESVPESGLTQDQARP